VLKRSFPRMNGGGSHRNATDAAAALLLPPHPDKTCLLHLWDELIPNSFACGCFDQLD